MEATRRNLVWGLRIGIGLLCLAVGVTVGLPHLLSQSFAHDRLTRRMTRDIGGNLQFERMRLRWSKPAEVDGVRFSAPDGRPVLEIAKARGTRSLFELLVDNSTFGILELTRPTLHLLLDENGSNIAAAVKPNSEVEFVKERLKDLQEINDRITGKIRIVDGCFVFQGAPERPRSRLEPANIELHVLGVDAARRLEIQPGTVVDHLDLDRELCNDLVQFVAPVLSRVSWVKGELSCTIREGMIPVQELGDLRLAGEIAIHDITAGPGPIVTAMARALEVSEEIQLVDESRIQFLVADQSVSHEGLQFQLGSVRVETQGKVGFDESLELTANVFFPPAAEGASELARRLAGRHARIPVTGSLSNPRIDWTAILEDHPFLDTFVERVLDPNDTPILDVVNDIRQLRQQRVEGGPTNGSDRPVRRLLRRFLQAEDASHAEAQEQRDR